MRNVGEVTARRARKIRPIRGVRSVVVLAVVGVIVPVLLLAGPAPAEADPAPPVTPTTTTTTTTTTPLPTPAADQPVTAAAVSISVTPHTDLVNLQTVTVAGTGFGAGQQVGFAACKNPSTGQENCDTNHVGFATTDGSGAFSTTFTVHRILHTTVETLDCASAPDACKIAVGQLSDFSITGSAPLSFDPSVPLPPPPVLQVFPSTDLVDGQDVLVLGTGYVPSKPISLFECIVGSGECVYVGGAGATVNGNGAFLTSIPVRRQIYVAQWSVEDCAGAPGACELRATSADDFDSTAAAPLDFDGASPLPSGTVTVTPDTGLAAFQTVTVEGTGFVVPAGEPNFVQVGVCKTGSTDDQDCVSSAIGVAADPDGAFTTPLQVRRVVFLGSGTFDCGSAPGACEVRALSYGPTVTLGHAPISFTPGPPPPPASITLTPASGLQSGDTITVDGSGFAPDTGVVLGQCVSSSASFCPFGLSDFVQTDRAGAFSQTMRVARGVLSAPPFPPVVVDCADASATCSITAYSFDQGDQASAPLDFDSGVPVPVPVVTVTPSQDLADRELVTVDASGFTPDAPVYVLQCPATAPYVYCSQAGPSPLTADSTGAVHVQLRVHRDLGASPFGGGTTNCAAAPGECVIRAVADFEPLESTDVPLGFDPTAVADPPVLTVSPPGPWTAGQQVTVQGAGFTPDATLGLAQCEADAPRDGGHCSQSLFDQFAADGEGTFTRTFTVTSTIQPYNGDPIDCTALAEGCVLFAANRTDYGAERAAVPVEFAAVTGPDTVPGALAFTGGGDRRVIGCALGAVLLGAILLVLSTRRTRRKRTRWT